MTRAVVESMEIMRMSKRRVSVPVNDWIGARAEHPRDVADRVQNAVLLVRQERLHLLPLLVDARLLGDVHRLTHRERDRIDRNKLISFHLVKLKYPTTFR